MTDFDEVYRRHLQAVFRFAVRAVGRRDVAEELTSDAFVALLGAFETIDLDRLPGWLFTVVRNRAMDYWRRAVVEQRYRADLIADPAVEPSRGILDWLDAVGTLKPVHRACLILRYVHGLERAEIGKRLGLSENQVKGHLQYAHQLLRKELIDSE